MSDAGKCSPRKLSTPERVGIGDDFAGGGVVEPVNHDPVEPGDRAHLAHCAAMEGLDCVRLRQPDDHRSHHGRRFHAAIGLRRFAFDDQEIACQMETEIESLLSPRE